MEDHLHFFGFSNSVHLLESLFATWTSVHEDKPIQCSYQIEILSRCYETGKEDTLKFLDKHIDAHIAFMNNKVCSTLKKKKDVD